MKESQRVRSVHGKLNNEGLSLIELVVALLILAVIATPLLQLFVSAARANKVNAEENSAETVASNVMEAVKVYGLEKTAEEFYKNETAPFNMAVSSSSDESVTPSIEKNLDGGTVNYTFITNSEKKYIYRMNGLKEGKDGDGENEFNVVITFDTDYKATDGSTDVNVKTTYDYSAFDEKKTVFINPLAADLYYDEEAISQFTTNNNEYIDLLNERERNAVIDAYNEALRDYQDKIAAGVSPAPTRPTDPPEVTGLPTMSPEEIKNVITRELKVTVSKETDASTEAEYLINSEFYYRPMAGYENKFSDGYYFKGNGFCTNVGVKELKYVYMFYIPYPWMTESNFTKNALGIMPITTAGNFSYKNSPEPGAVPVINQTLSVVNETNVSFDFYLALQGASDESLFTTFSKGAYSTGNVSFFSNSLLSIADSRQELIRTISGLEKISIAKVTVDVYKDGELVRTMTSTIEE